MKKIGLGVGLFLLAASAVFAAKPVNSCHYVVDGNIPYPTGHYLASEKYTTGYDAFGYNYQAHIFNGTYGNAYFGRSGWAPYAGDDEAYLDVYPTAASHWAWPFRNVNLQMKWNDAWLANKDCETPTDVLDRHAGLSTYRGSGAWLTNHATGTYTSSVNYNWNVSGTWNFDVDSTVWGGTYPKTMTITQDSSGNITGTGNNVPPGNTWSVTGSVSGNSINFSLAYDAPMAGYVATFNGNIDLGGALSGTWSDVWYSDSGPWHSTGGLATKDYATCTVSDFVKIVAVPTNAVHGDVTGYYNEGMWYESDGISEIGPTLWGEFAVIQEEASDPCGEYGVINYMSPLKKGLGNWED